MLDKSIEDVMAAASVQPADPLAAPAQQAMPSFSQPVPLVGSAPQERVAIESLRPTATDGDRMSAALYLSGTSNPDDVAHTQRLASMMGVEPGFVRIDRDNAERQAAAETGRLLRIPESSPRMAEALSDEEFAAIAHDDLSNIGRTAYQLSQDSFAKWSFLPDFVDRAYFDTMMAFSAGEAQSTTGRIVLRENIIHGQQQLSEQARQEYVKSLVYAPPSDKDGLFMGSLKYAATQLGQKYANADIYLTLTAGGAAAGAPVAGVGAIPGAGIGFRTAAFVDGFTTEAGLSYINMRAEGIQPDVARNMATAHGVVAGILEAWAAKFAAAPVQKAAKAIMPAASRQAVTRVTKDVVIKEALIDTAKINVSEAFTESMQAASAELITDLGRMAQSPEWRGKMSTPEGKSEIIGRVMDEFWYSFKYGWLMSSTGPTINAMVQIRSARKAEAQLAKLGAAIDNSADSKARKRNPELYAQALRIVTQGTDAESLYIDADEVDAVLAQSGTTLDVLDSALPGIAAQYAQSRAEGGTPIRLSTADYLARMAGTPIEPAMRQHLRVSPDGLSLAQVAARAEHTDRLVAEMARVRDEIERIEQGQGNVLDALEDRARKAIQDANPNMTPFQQDTMARFYRDTILVRAAREGMLVEEYERQHGMQIMGEVAARIPQPAAAQSLNQQAITRIDSAYADAVSRGDTETAQQMVDAAAQQAMPNSAVRGDGDIGIQGRLLRVFHGSGTTIRRFMYQFTGQGVDQLGSGFYFTTDRPEAVSYTTRRRDAAVEKIGGEDRPTVVEAYLDIRNPLRSDQVGSITRDQVRRFIAAAPEDSRRDGLANWGIDGNTPTSAVLDAYALQDTTLLRALFKIGNDFYGKNTEAFSRAISDILGYDGVVQDFRSDGVAKLHYVAFFPEQIKSAEPTTTDDAGNVVPLSRRFNMTSADIFEQPLSTRVPTAKGMELAALEDMLIADLEAMMKSDRMVDGNLRIAEELGVPVNIDKTLPKAQQLQQVIQFMVDNLLALHDKMDAQQRERAKLWYVGGRRIVDEMAKRYGITDMQAAAMLAVLSPQKNWFENVSMAFRIGDILSAQREATWNDAVDRAFRKEVADIRASVPVAEARLAQAIEDTPRRTRQRKAETDAAFAKRVATWERTKKRKLARYSVDLAAWEADLERLDEQIGEAAENGESTAELRAERAAINRSRPRRPRAPVQVTAETDAEYADRKAGFAEAEKEHANRVDKLTKAVAGRKNAVKRIEALEQSTAVRDLRAGQTLGELLETKNLDMAARFVRYLDETGNSREFAIITPEGGMAGPSQGKDGPLTMRWGSYSTIAKAISVYEDGRVENVHHQIGMAHKVRNFYNNLFDPTNPNAGTIDTHAIAAALLQALGSSSNLVSWGLGSGVSDARLGLHGGYPLVYEAYRQAAQQRGLLVREMQSITWEAVRGLFEAAMKKTLAEPVAKVWARHKAGEITIEQARNEIFALANGITDPEWVTQPTDLPVTSTYTGASNTAMESVRETSPRESQPATVSFEVAPDPRDTALKQQWKALSAAQRQQISMNVASAIVPQVMAEYGVSAQVTMQTGGWKGDSNVSFAITMPAGPLVRQVGMAIGWVLSQQAVYSFSKTKYTGADRTTMVVVKLADGISPSEIANLYETKLHGTGIMGHSTSGSVMYIAVDSKSGLDAGELANTIATATDNDPRVESVVTLEGWSKEDNVTEKPTTEVERAGAEPTRLVPPAAQRRRLDLWRSEASSRIAAAIDASRRQAGEGTGRRYALAAAEARGLSPLAGAPAQYGIHGPDPRIVAVAREYARANGLPFGRQSEYATVNVERARRIAKAYEDMRNAPDDPAVREAYADLIRQTRAQYDALVAAGFSFYFFDGENDPYASQEGGFGNPWNAVRELRENQRMAVYPTMSGYGTDLAAADYDVAANPLLEDTGLMWPWGSPDGALRPVLANDLFRAVHDAFGHSLEGAGFRARGEENAWQAHVRLFYGPAVGAMTSETRGQNSWLNYGPHGEANRNAKVADTVFADQKVGLMPEWTWKEGIVADIPYPVIVDPDQAFMQAPISPTFYSALEQAIDSITSAALTPDSWKQQIRGFINKGIVKADEYEWSGLEEFLDGVRDGGKVTRDEVLNFLRTNGIKVTVVETRAPDVALGAGQNPRREARARARVAAADIARDALIEEGLLTDDLDGALNEYQQAVRNGAAHFVLDSIIEPVDEVLDEAFGTSVEAYAQDNIDLHEVDLGAYVVDATQYRRWTLPGGTEYREIRVTIPVTTPRLNRSENMSVAGAPEFYEYTIDGVAPSIYSAHVTKMPDGMYEVIKQGWRTAFPTLAAADAYIRKTLLDDAEQFSERVSFKSSHWAERNIVVHLRLTTRIDADGKRVLFVEEIQSDWGQQGRAHGFRNRIKLAELRKRVHELQARQSELDIAAYAGESLSMDSAEDAILAAIKEYGNGESGAADAFAAMSDDELAAKYSLDTSGVARLRTWVQWTINKRDLRVARSELMRMNEQAIPSGPFVENTDAWTTLGLKQILIEAVKGKYDRVAFVTGDQTVQHYRDALVQSVDGVQIVRETDGTYSVNAYKGEETLVEENNIRRERIAELFGKAGADQLITAADAAGNGQVVDVEAGNLEVGGAGLRKHYGQIVPKNLQKLLKKFGGSQIGETRLPEAEVNMPEQANRMDFDEAAARQVLERGGIVRLTLWSREGRDGASIRIADVNALDQAMLDYNDFDYMDVVSAGTQPSTAQMSFDVTPELVSGLSGGIPLFQAQPSEPFRGAFDPRRMMMMLTSRSDVSTVLHEMSHYHLVVLANLASAPNATQRAKTDMDIALRWFGIAGATPEERLANWNAMSITEQRPFHEQWAYNFEIYMFEGRSPSLEMQGAFERFAQWIKRVYKSIRDDLNEIYRKQFGRDLPMLTAEVRQVFDRMLATDEQIERAESVRNMRPLFMSQEESGMTDAEWAEYQQMARRATDDAVSELNTASLRVMEWLSGARTGILRKLQKEHDKLRKEVRDEVEEQVRREPVYRAISYLRSGESTNPDGTPVKALGPHRLDMDALESMYPVGMKDRPNLEMLGTGGYGLMGADGIHPDVAGEMFGYASGDQLVRAILAAKPMNEEIVDRTDRIMVDRYGDMNSPQAQKEAVERALHNEARARFVAAEARFLSKAREPVRVMLEAARSAAAQIIGQQRVRDISAARYAAGEARAARDAEMAYKKRQTPQRVAQTVYTRVYNELLSGVAAGAMTEADAIAQAQAAANAALTEAKARDAEYKARYGDARPEEVVVQAKRNQLVQNQLAKQAIDALDEVRKAVKYMRNVLRDENRRRMGADVSDQIAAILERFELRGISLDAIDRRRSLAEWMEEQRALGIDPDVPESIANEARRMSYRDMTLNEFRDLVDSVKQLEHIGRNRQKALAAARTVEFEKARDEIVESIKREGAARGREYKPRTAQTKIGRRMQNVGRFFASHLKSAVIVQILDGGKDDGPLWNYLIRTVNAVADRKVAMCAKATEDSARILNPVIALGPMGGKGMYFPSLNTHLNREARLVIALNYGNEGNRQRLLDGEGWTADMVRPVLESLTQAEWVAVQQIWDYFETYRPMIADKERRLYGKEPKWVEPSPIEVTTADGVTMQLRGGYYPIKYDPRASTRAEKIEDATKAREQMQAAHIATTTRRSFTKARANEVVGSPLLYSLSGLYSGINEVIHDLTHHEWLIDANRLLGDKEFDAAVRQRLGSEYLRQLKNWVNDVAAGERGMEYDAEIALNFLRQNISAAGLGFNISSAILQITGFNQSIVKVGARWVGLGIAQSLRNPIESARMVSEKSSFMQSRGRTQFRELNEIRNMVQGQSTAMRRVQLGVYFLMMRMQRAVDVPTWIGAYEKSIAAGNDEDTSVALADQAVIDSQGSGMVKDLAAVERGGPLLKIFTVFYQYMNTVYNLAALRTMSERNKAKLAADYIMLFTVPVVLNYGIKNALRPDAEDEEFDMEKLSRELAAAQLEYLMGMMVIVREFAGQAKVVMGVEGVRTGYTGPAGLRMIEDFGRFGTQAMQGEFDSAFRRSAINLLGDTLGIPSAQINRMWDSISGLVEGDIEDPTTALRAALFGIQR